MRYTLIFIVLFSLLLSNCRAQENFKNTMSFTNTMTSPDASLSDVSWIAGHWKGKAFGGIIEEFWSPPLGDSMMFVFKLVVDNAVVFYEIGGIRQIDKTLIFQLKHFGNDFKGWEEKDETVDAKLIKIEKNRVYFDDFTFEKVSDTEINIYVVVSENNTKEEVTFNYKKRQ